MGYGCFPRINKKSMENPITTNDTNFSKESSGKAQIRKFSFSKKKKINHIQTTAIKLF
jgi:hypothetical protein